MKRIISVLLAVLMLAAVIPFASFAYTGVVSIVFTPAEQAVRYVNTDGKIETDGGGQEFFYYYIPWFKEGDQLSIRFNGASTPVDYVYNEDEHVFVSEGGDRIDSSEFYVTSDQNQNHWTVGSENYYQVEYGGAYSNKVPVTIIESPYSAMKYNARNTSYTKETNGYYTTDEHDVEYFNYFFSMSEGDVIILTDKAGNSKQYTASFDESIGEYVFEAPDGDSFTGREIRTEDDQNENHWTAGNSYAFSVSVFGVSCTVNVDIVENPVSSIEVVKANPITRYVETDGQFETDYEGQSYFRYYTPWFEDGDILYVEYTGGSRVKYVYQHEADGFVSETDPGDIISVHDNKDFWSEDDQSRNHWTVGSDNYFDYVYYGRHATCAVTIIESPFKSMQFVSVTKTLMEGKDGDYETDEGGNSYYRYRFPIREGDKIILTDKSGNVKEYVYSHDPDTWERFYVAADGERLYEDDLRITDDQYQNHWTVGSSRSFTVTLYGVSCTVPFDIIENPIASIEFVKAESPIVKYFEVDGYYEIDENGETYFRYSYPWFTEGDKLTVHYKNGTTAVYVGENGEEGFIFRSDSGIIDTNKEDINFYSDQYEHHWTLGGDNYYDFNYEGFTAKVPVTIIENPVKSISIVLHEELIAYSNYYETYFDDEGHEVREYHTPRLLYGTDLIVTDKDGSQHKYTLNGGEQGTAFYDDKGGVITMDECHIYTKQYEKPWTVGGDNKMYAEYNGVECSFPVSLIDSDVLSIDYECPAPYEYQENEGGEWRYGYDAKFYYYFINYDEALSEGASVTITYTDNSVVKYNFSKEKNAFVSENGDTLVNHEFNLDDKDIQWYQHWKLGANYYELVYHGAVGRIPVIVVNSGHVHNYGDEIQISAPTLTEEGLSAKICEGCGNAVYTPIPKLVNDGTINKFKDVKKNDWFYNYVVFGVQAGLISGTSPTTVSPNGLTTRAQFVQILYNTAGKPDTSSLKNPFKDVKKTDWFYNAVVWAVSVGVTSGTSANTFSPSNNVTREQVVMFLKNYAEKVDNKLGNIDIKYPPVSETLGAYTDRNQVSGWALDAVKWGVQFGLISGTTKTTVSPKGTATRAQVVTMFANYLHTTRKMAIQYTLDTLS